MRTVIFVCGIIVVLGGYSYWVGKQNTALQIEASQQKRGLLIWEQEYDLLLVEKENAEKAVQAAESTKTEIRRLSSTVKKMNNQLRQTNEATNKFLSTPVPSDLNRQLCEFSTGDNEDC